MADKYGPLDNEASIVRAAFLRMKSEKGLTQDSMAESLEVTQGVVGRWLNGHKRIPDDKLLKMAVMLGFNPLDVRPKIQDFVDLANIALSGKERSSLLNSLSDLTESEKDQMLKYRDFLLSQRQQQKPE